MGFRYIGTKTKVISEVLEKTKKIVDPGAHVVDLMCGTASVSIALRKSGYRVTANDVMTYSYHHARVMLLFTSPPQFKNCKEFVNSNNDNSELTLFQSSPYESVLHTLESVTPRREYFWTEFSLEGKPSNRLRPRNYFSPRNSMKIDAIRYWIRTLFEKGKINDLEHSLLLHDLIMAANDVANIAGTYGHYLSKIVGRAADSIKLKPTKLTIQNDSGKHAVTKGFAEEISRELKCDLCYIDPPYMKRQYAANYHILETIAREDMPEAQGLSGLRPWRDQYSNFCTKTRIRNSFEKIITQMNCRDFLISYSEDGLLSIQDLKRFFSRFGKVMVTNFTNKRFKSNNSKLESSVTEYLIHLKKN